MCEPCDLHLNKSQDCVQVQDDPKLLGDSGGEVPISKWSGWWFNFCCEILFLFDMERKEKKTWTR